MDFGPYFSLQPFYAWADEVEPRDGLTPASDAPSLWDVRTYGADIMVNLARGSFVPFVKGGGGLLRVTPDGGEESDRILLRYGGGLRFGLGDRLGAELTAENWTTRLSQPFVAGAVADDEFPDDGIVGSWVYGAGVRIPLGAGFEDSGFRGLVPGIAMEPFAVRTDFADEFDLGRQYGAGVRAGVDFNQNVGLRAHYWRGTDDDFSEFQDVEGYGAEARFSLNTGPGLSPFLVGGLGRIRFTEDFFDVEGDDPGDLDHLILGGGVAFSLGDIVRVDLGARNLLMTPGEQLEDVTDPDDLVSSWQYSAGLSLRFGAGARTRSSVARADESAQERANRILEEEMERRDAEVERLREENRRLRAGEDPASVERARVLDGDTVRAGRTMVIPVPEVGEIILRYGEAYAGQSRQMTSEEAQRVEGAVTDAVVSGGLGMSRDELAALIRDAVRQELRALGIQEGARAPVVVMPGGATPTPGVQVVGEGFQWKAGSVEPYSGLQFRRDVQVLLGVRASMGFLRPNVPVEVIPELAFGFGEGDMSLLLGLNGRYTFGLGGERRYEPYLQLGAALTNQRLLSINPAYGLKFDVASDDRGNPIRIFVEHQGLQLYDDHRILAGIVLNR